MYGMDFSFKPLLAPRIATTRRYRQGCDPDPHLWGCCIRIRIHVKIGLNQGQKIIKKIFIIHRNIYNN